MAGMETPNDLMATFSGAVSAGFDALQGPVNGVFGLMIALVVALTGVQWTLSPGRDLLAGAFSKILLVGTFAYLINDWQGLAETFQAGFIDLGLAAGGGTLSRGEFLNPGAVLETGWEIVKALGETPAPVNDPLDLVGNLTDALILGLSMIGIMIAFAILALQIIVTLLEFKIVTLGGFILLPFGIWSKSAFLAERPLGYVVAAGLKVLALAIVVSLARSIFDQLQPTENPDLYEALAILAAALLLAMLAIFIPSLAAALVTGGPALGAGAAVNGALAVAAGGGAAAVSPLALGRGLAASHRTAALAGAGRASLSPGGPTSPPPAPGSPPTPSSGPPLGPPPGGGGGGRPQGRQVPEPTPVESPPPAAGAQPAAPGRAPQTIEDEAARAHADFRSAVKGRPAPSAGARSSAMQAFFAANAARSLLPGSESSGTLSPQLKTRET